MKKYFKILLFALFTFSLCPLLFCNQSDKTTPNESETFTITYNNMEGAINAPTNPSVYSENSEDIILKAPTKAAQTFCGWYDNSSFTGSKIETIPSGSTGNKVFWAKWETYTGFSGIVSVGDDPAINRTVSFYRSDGSLAGSTNTDNEGYYEMKNLDPGAYYLGFSVDFWWKDPIFSNPESITLALGDFKTVSFSIPASDASSGYLRGTVQDMGTNGATPVPAFKAKITLSGNSGAVLTAWAGPDGNYRFHNLSTADSPYSVVVTYAGCSNATSTGIFIINEVTTTINFDLLRN